MSFYSYKNANADTSPGQITGNAMDGICERICIQVKNVYDSCLQQEQLNNKEVTVSNIVPVLPNTNCGSQEANRNCRCDCSGNKCNCRCGTCGEITYQDALENAETAECLPQPCGTWTFESCRSSTTEGVISNLSVDRLCDRPQFARVKGDVSIPIDVLFIDQKCQEWMGQATLRVSKDVLLAIPDESIVPFTLESLVSAICVSGRYVGNCKFQITICVTVVLKILAEVEVMVPSYGFCEIPPCEEFAESVCDEFFSLPIFPRSSACQQTESTAAANTSTGGCSFYTGGKPTCSGSCSANGSVAGATTTGCSCSTCSNCGTSCAGNSTLCPRCGCTMTGSN
ncbi:MAG: hypothetical protein Q4E18_01450 [Clostridia bacterium]|nr:hypothetical protein [Clostridia bacterium]